MSKILSVDGDDEGFNATIKTDIGEISWHFDSYAKCCEKFGTKLSRPLSWLLNKKFKNINLDNEGSQAILTLKLDSSWDQDDNIRDELSSFVADNDHIRAKDLERFVNSLTDSEWTIIFYNHHNGYYCHNLDVSIDGVTKWNLSL